MPKQKQSQDQGRNKQNQSTGEEGLDDREPQRRDGGIDDDQERIEPGDAGEGDRQNVSLPDQDAMEPQGNLGDLDDDDDLDDDEDMDEDENEDDAVR